MGDLKKEVSLIKWCSRLPKDHRVNQELTHLVDTLHLYRLMILGGESNSEKSREMYYKAMDIIEGKEPEE